MQQAAQPAGPPLAVIFAGFPRTGTASTKVALDKLFQGTGRRCHHMLEVFANQEHKAWADLYSHGWDKEGQNIMTLLHESYLCTIDAPSMMFWKELLACNPGAKVLLTVSLQVAQGRGTMGAPVQPKDQAHDNGIFGKAGLFQGRFEDREFARGVYDAYIEDVKRTVPPDQLLVFNVKEGWAPLCKFLNVPVPDVPFPRVNDTTQFSALLPPLKRKVRLLTFGPLAAMAGLALGALGLAGRRRAWR